MRTIGIVSGDRSELGLLRPVYNRIHKDRGLNLRLLITHRHFSKLHGSVKDIRKDGIPFRKIAGESFGQRYDNFVKEFRRGELDFVLVIGDREDALIAAHAASRTQVPIAHIHGGDKTASGHIDEAVRHSITRFAHIHFAACRSSADRLKNMGEELFRIKMVGSPVIDAFLDVMKKGKKVSLKTLKRKYGLDADEDYILCLQHPTILESDESGIQMENTLAALDILGMQSIVIYPNGDPGTEDMVKVIEVCRKHSPWMRVHKSIHHNDFCILFKHAEVIVGNSSAGMIEGSYFRNPVVNVGIRNKGRENGGNVIFCGHPVRSITAAIKKALIPEFRRQSKKGPNVYGRGKSSEKIVKVLKSIPINDKLLRKQITF